MSHAFLHLPEYAVASAALAQIVDRLRDGDVRKRRPSGVPLAFIWGDSGVGKSHLLRVWRQELPSEWDVTSRTAAEFAAELADASVAGTIGPFQERYRRLRLLVLEDLHQISGRDESQKQIEITIDEIIAGGGTVVLTSRVPAGQMGRFSRRLVDRSRGGVTAEIQRPSASERARLVEHFAATRQSPFTEAMIDRLAESIAGTAPELLSAVESITVSARARNRRPNMADVDDYLAREPQPNGPDASAIVRQVARHFGVTVPQLKSASREQSITIARQAAMWLLRHRTTLSLSRIGELLGDRSHNTVLHGCRKTEERATDDAAFAVEMERLAES